MEFFRAEFWSGYPFPSPGDLPNPGIKPRSPTLWVDSLPAETQGSIEVTYLHQMWNSIMCISSVQSLSHVWFFATPWTTALQAFLSITNSRSLLKLMSIHLVMPSNHLILWHLLLLPSFFPSIRVFSNESALRIRWPKHWSFSFNISTSNEYSGLFPLEWTGWISLQSKGLSRIFSNTTVQKHQFFSAQLSL